MRRTTGLENSHYVFQAHLSETCHPIARSYFPPPWKVAILPVRL